MLEICGWCSLHEASWTTQHTNHWEWVIGQYLMIISACACFVWVPVCQKLYVHTNKRDRSVGVHCVASMMCHEVLFLSFYRRWTGVAACSSSLQFRGDSPLQWSRDPPPPPPPASLLCCGPPSILIIFLSLQTIEDTESELYGKPFSVHSLAGPACDVHCSSRDLSLFVWVPVCQEGAT